MLSIASFDGFAHMVTSSGAPSDKTRHSSAAFAPTHRRGLNPVSRPSKALRGWMQLPGRRSDPAHEDVPPSVAEAFDAAREIACKQGVLRR